MKKAIFAISLSALFALSVLPFEAQAKEFVVRTPSTAEALAAARAASQATGVSATILMGVFRQESGAGVNVGKDHGEWLAYCSTHSGVACTMWESKDCKPGYGNAQHFPEIIAALGYAKEDVKTSFTCALGFMQVEPATWWAYYKHGGDPWEINEAMLASATYLKYLKDLKNVGDITALAMYYCGPGGADNPECQSYADGVLEKAGLSADAYGLSSFKKDVAVLTFINIGQQIKGAVEFLKNQKIADKTNKIVALMSFQSSNVRNYCKGESCQYSYIEEKCTNPCSEKEDCCIFKLGGTPCCMDYNFIAKICVGWEIPECDPMSITGYCCKGFKQSLPRIANCALSPPCNPISPNDDPCPSTIEIGPGETKTFEGILMEAQAAAAKIGAISTDPGKLGKYETELEKAVETMKKCMESEDEFILSCTDTFDWFEEGGIIPQELITRGDVPESLRECEPGRHFYCMNAEGDNEIVKEMTFPIAPLKETADKLANLLKAAEQCKCERVKYACDLTLPNNYTDLMCKCPIGTSCNESTQELFCKLTANKQQCSNDCKPIEVGSSPFRISVKAIGNTLAIPGFKDIKKGIASTTIPVLRGYYTALENSIEALGEAYSKENEQRGIVYTCSDMRQVLKSYLDTGDIKYCPSGGSFKCCPPIDSAGVKLVQEIKNCEATDFFFCGDEIAITLTPAPITPGAEPPAHLPPIDGLAPGKTIPFATLGAERQWQDASDPLKNLLLCIYNNFPGTPPEILAISDANIKDRGGTDDCDYKTWRDFRNLPGTTAEDLAAKKGSCQENSNSLHYGRSGCKLLKPDTGFSFAVDLSDTNKIDTIIRIINDGSKDKEGKYITGLDMNDGAGNITRVPCLDLFSGKDSVSGERGSIAVKGGSVKIENDHIHLWVPIGTVAPGVCTRSYCYPLSLPINPICL